MSSSENTKTSAGPLRSRFGQQSAETTPAQTCIGEQLGHSKNLSNAEPACLGSARPVPERDEIDCPDSVIARHSGYSNIFRTIINKLSQPIRIISSALASRIISLCFHSSWNLWLLLPATLRRRFYLYLQANLPRPREPFQACRLPGGFALKVKGDPLVEVSNMRFIEANTSIPVPHVYDWIPSQGGPHKSGLILMSWIEGENLRNWLGDRTYFPDEYDALVDHLANGKGVDIKGTIAKLETFTPEIDYSDASFVVDDLRQAISQLRALKPPGDGRVCGLNGQPLNCLRYNGDILYPVKDVPTFHQILLDQVGWKEIRLPRILQIGQNVFAKDYEIRFAHSDLNPTNILIKDGRLAAIIDWEMAGWYPEYWEYTMLHLQNRNRKPLLAFWRHVNPCGQQYEEELAFERALWHSSADTFIPPGVIENDPYDAPVE